MCQVSPCCFQILIKGHIRRFNQWSSLIYLRINCSTEFTQEPYYFFWLTLHIFLVDCLYSDSFDMKHLLSDSVKIYNIVFSTNLFLQKTKRYSFDSFFRMCHRNHRFNRISECLLCMTERFSEDSIIIGEQRLFFFLFQYWFAG